MGGNKKPLYIK